MTKFNLYLNKAERFYRKNTEYYHTYYHIKRMFQLLEDCEELFDKEFNNQYNKDIVCWAIAYHDSFYMPGFVKNEEISAIIAKIELIPITSHVDEIEQIILNTNPKNTYFPTVEDKIVHDLDWSSFCSYSDMN